VADDHVINSIRFDPAGRRLVAASERGIHVYDVRTGKRLLDLKGPHSRVQQVQFLPTAEDCCPWAWKGP